LALGVYPETTLAEAREKRDKARKLIAAGQDPALHKKEEKRRSLLNSENRFEAIAREWHALQAEKWTKHHAAYTLRRLEANVFPEIGAFPIADITAPQLLAAIRKVESRGAQEIAHRALQTTGQVFRYAIVTGRAERDPSSDLKRALRAVKRGHYAALDTKELPAFLVALERNDARLFTHTRHAIRLLLLTFVRTSELINASWGEFDLENKEWIIPPERMKMRNAHIVPLSTQALSIIKELKELNGASPWLLPNQVEPRKSMSNNTVLFLYSKISQIF
jgi:integrase